MALRQANNPGLLRQLGKELIKEGLVTGKFQKHLAAAVGGSAFQLQRFQGGVFHPFDARVGAQDMLAACDQVCRIDIDGLQTGTGVRVSQTLVATAAHVVWKLVTVQPDGSLRAAADGLRRLTADLRQQSITWPRTIGACARREGDSLHCTATGWRG